MRTDAKNYISLSILAYALGEMTDSQKQLMTFFLLDNGLMRPSAWLRLPLKFVKWSKGSLGIWNFVRKVGQPFSDNMINQTFVWMLEGHDTEERTSIGGFSQREIDLIVGAYEKITE